MGDRTGGRVSLRLNNAQDGPLTVILEPWASEYQLLPGLTFDVVETDGDPAELIEVQVGAGTLTLFARTGAKMSIFHEGAELP
jgi:hypothetical protein